MSAPDTAAAVFSAGVICVLYVLFGYPLLLAWRARRSPRPLLRKSQPRSVSVILPVRNGERWIDAKLRSLLALKYPRELMEILVISDGSTDGTTGIARGFQSEGVEVIECPARGKAATLNAGIARARGEILFLTDIRQPVDPDALDRLVACFADPAVGVASGELIILEGNGREEADVGLYWKYEKWIRRRQSLVDSVIGATGAIYAMRRELAVALPEDTLLDDVHLPLAAFFRGYRVVFEETALAFDNPAALEAEFRRKVRTLAGNYQLLVRFPQLLGPANRMWFHFVSHKLGRLMLPFALLAVAASSFWLPGFWKWPALAGQTLFYWLAAADRTVGDRSPLKRISSPVRTFVVLMGAALCAVSFFFVPARRLWKSD